MFELLFNSSSIDCLRKMTRIPVWTVFIVIIEYYDKATKVYWSTIEHKLLLNSNYLPLIIRFSLIFRIRTGLGPLRHPSQ